MCGGLSGLGGQGQVSVVVYGGVGRGGLVGCVGWVFGLGVEGFLGSDRDGVDPRGLGGCTEWMC